MSIIADMGLTEETMSLTLDDKRLWERAADALDKDQTSWVDENRKPRSCYVCPFSFWHSDYKRCSVLKQPLHPKFRIDARLKACPIRIDGLQDKS